MAALASSHEDLTDLDSSVEPTVAPDPVPAEDLPDKITSPCRFFLEGRCHFGTRCRNPHPGAADGAHHSDVHRPVQAGSPQLPSGKKPAMKTAEDVISRILWDNQIPAGHFSIGYLDRFLGILEEPFAAFSWEDLASAGPGVLAIPKHRIQYFKYKDRVVWDKATRTDDVFGSTGSRTTILDVIKEEEEAEAFKEKDHHLKEEGEKEAGAGAGEMARHNGQDEDGAAASEQEEQLKRIKGEDEIRDAEVEVDNLKSSGHTCTILSGNEVNREKEGSRQVLIPENDLTEVGEGNSASQSGRARFFPHSKQRPTHFIAVHVTSSEIRASVQLLQDALCNVCPDLVKFCVPLGTLHLTLCLLHLSTPAEIHKAVTVLQELQANSQRLLPPALLVNFNSVEMFYSRVLYLSPVPVLELRRLAQELENAFSQKGLVVIQPPDKDSFHMTVAKIPLKERAVQLPADTSWLPITEALGTQVVEALYLCEIGKGRRADGFYTTVLKVGLY